ncbi:hypothetical protein IMZ48_49815 [Candidatus Bathyarchaeota archaeon]|nr:hypothetical protein [Candidatus Bathyarchaeota archaeon]
MVVDMFVVVVVVVGVRGLDGEEMGGFAPRFVGRASEVFPDGKKQARQ